MTVEGGKPGKKSDRKSIQIVDGQTGTVICLMPGTKTAVVQNFKNLPPKSAIGGTFQSLRELVVNAQSGKAGKVERLGAKTIDGHAAEGFRIQVGVMDTKIWADPKSLLPIRVEEVSRSGTGFKVSRVMTDFQTNVDLDKSLFSLDVPPGYTVPQTLGVKEAPSAEAPKLPEPKARAKPQDHRGDAATATIAWGDTVKDLQLGLARQAETNAPAVTVSDGSSVLVQVSLRNTGKSPIRLLASVHTCLLGEGGSNALLVSRLVLKPKAGGDPFSMVYKAWNHLSLLDKRRPKSEQPQQTLNGSYGKTDIQLNPDDAKRMTTVLASGETRVAHVAFTLHKRILFVATGEIQIGAARHIRGDRCSEGGSGTVRVEGRTHVRTHRGHLSSTSGQVTGATRETGCQPANAWANREEPGGYQRKNRRVHAQAPPPEDGLRLRLRSGGRRRR